MTNQPPVPPPPPQPPSQPPAQPDPQAAPVATQVPAQAKSGKATAAMVLGIIALVGLFCFWIVLEVPSLVMGILAIIFGHQAKNEIAANPQIQGEGQAKAGFIMGIIATSLCGLFFLLMVIGAIAD